MTGLEYIKYETTRSQREEGVKVYIIDKGIISCCTYDENKEEKMRIKSNPSILQKPLCDCYTLDNGIFLKYDMQKYNVKGSLQDFLDNERSYNIHRIELYFAKFGEILLTNAAITQSHIITILGDQPVKVSEINNKYEIDFLNVCYGTRY